MNILLDNWEYLFKNLKNWREKFTRRHQWIKWTACSSRSGSLSRLLVGFIYALVIKWLVLGQSMTCSVISKGFKLYKYIGSLKKIDIATMLYLRVSDDGNNKFLYRI